MDSNPTRNFFMARRENSRRAMSLLELSAVGVILGILSLAVVTRYGHNTIGNGEAGGYARKLALSLGYARRATISTGENHYLQLTSSGYTLMRRTSGGDIQVDQTNTVPADATINSASSALEFDFEGAALGAYTVTVAGPDRSWDVSVVMLTGAVQVVELP